jgi:hypothetical protein
MFGVGFGPSKNEKSNYNALSGFAGFAGGHGEKDIGTAEDWMQGILSGDPAKISKLLGPQIKGIQDRAQQTKQTAAEFGNRSGGTNASMQMVDDNVHSDINSMIDSLTGGAVSQIGSMGQNLLGMGMQGEHAAFGDAKTMQEQEQAKWKDIFDSISGVVGAVAGMPGVSKVMGGNLSKVLTGAAGAIG